MRSVRLAEKAWLKVPFANLLEEKNTIRWLKKYDLEDKRAGQFMPVWIDLQLIRWLGFGNI
jgi:hypothetical protein